LQIFSPDCDSFPPSRTPSVEVEIIRESAQAKSMRGRRCGDRQLSAGDFCVGGPVCASFGGVQVGGANDFCGSNR